MGRCPEWRSYSSQGCHGVSSRCWRLCRATSYPHTYYSRAITRFLWHDGTPWRGCKFRLFENTNSSQLSTWSRKKHIGLGEVLDIFFTQFRLTFVNKIILLMVQQWLETNRAPATPRKMVRSMSMMSLPSVDDNIVVRPRKRHSYQVINSQSWRNTPYSYQ